jgi:abortive infection bacteriophage resistance protein
MSKINFSKPPLTFDQQINLMKSRGLLISDVAKAKDSLKQISYFRLSAYFLPYQSQKDAFNDDVTFEQIINTYNFDRDLRILIFEFIESIEIAIRTQIIYNMSMNYNNSHWHDDKSLFKPEYSVRLKNGSLIKINPFTDLQLIFNKSRNSAKPEIFIKHYIDKYSYPVNPPSWMCFELLTIGELSHVFKGLNNNKDKQAIADYFDLHHDVFASWLHSIASVRNICAHHSRLWNKELGVEPFVLRKPKGKWVGTQFHNNKRLFYFLCTLQYLLIRLNKGNDFKSRILTLFDKYSSVPIKYLGIPSDGNGNLLNWQNEPLWQ